MKKTYDYVVVGAGLYGSTFARIMTDRGHSCLVIEKRDHVGGLAYTKNIHDIDVHMHGAHIFHTNDRRAWDFVNRFASFNHFINSPMAIYGDEIYNLPFNMNTFSKMWDIQTPDEAKTIIEQQRKKYGVKNPKNLEEQAISLVGRDIYEKLIRGYTKKQWGTDPKNLPAFIIKRLPVRFTYDNNYFNAIYQGIPDEGYTAMVETMLEGIDVRLNTDFLDDRDTFMNLADTLVYTGPIDAFFNHGHGPLAYRSLRFEHEIKDCPNVQGNAVINYTAETIPYTRIIEHKHFTSGTQPRSIITREYPLPWSEGKDPYYPINDEKNNSLYRMYEKEAAKQTDVLFGGRLAEYTYYDMDEVILRALNAAENELARR